jgi:glycosyltransferase involved in cell wall biosynthesis
MKNKITIGIPTFNRGHKALSGVEAILNKLPVGVDILIVDNDSQLQNESYFKISNISKSHPRKLKYIRNPANIGMAGSIGKLLDEITSDWFILCSDEDIVNIEYLDKLISISNKYKDIGIVRGGISPLINYGGSTCSFPDIRLTAGIDALKGFGFHNNYISGIAYNLTLLKSKDIIQKFHAGVWAHHDYPHLYLDSLSSVIADIQFLSTVSCWQGDPEGYNDPGNEMKYKSPYTVGARLDQFWATQKGVFEALNIISDQIKTEDWGNLYLAVCDKYLRLVAVIDAFLYARNNLEIKQIIDCSGNFMKSAIPKNFGYEFYVKVGWRLDNLIAQYISKVESP